MQEQSYLAERILVVATRKFMRDGYSRVTTDDIAYDAGISKKTLYRFIPSKKRLISQVIDTMLENINLKLDVISQNPALNSIEKIVATIEVVAERIARISKIMMQDFSRSIPEEWKKIEEFRKNAVTGRMKKLILQAKEEGFIRENVNIDLFVEILSMIVENSFVPEVLEKTTYKTIVLMEEMIKIVFLGIVTDAGQDRFGRFRKTDEEEGR